MKCGEIIEQIEKQFPPVYAQEWDNVGLLVGHEDQPVSRVMLALDATEDVIRQAAREKSQLLITHHPMIFHGVKQINDRDFTGRKILRLAEQGIACYAMHTNFDVMGMAKALADLLELTDSQVLMEVLPSGKEEYTAKEPQGIGRVGMLPKPMTLTECAGFVKKVLDLPYVTVSGPADRILRRAAVSSGSGRSMISYGLAKKAEVLITGDIGHHEALDAGEQGLCIIDGGHYGTEKLFAAYMEKWLGKEFPDLECVRAVQEPVFFAV